MLKDYFTDGLIQIAILLSLLRTDLNTLLSSYVNQADCPELNEIILGQTSAFTQTHVASPYWNYGLGYTHPKNIESYYRGSVLEELNSLGGYGRFEGVDTNIESWLVSVAPNHHATSPTPAESHNGAPGESQAQNQGDNNNNRNQQNLPIGAVEVSAPEETEGAVGSREWWTRVFPVNDLTKEDMDLIDVLWRQDIDLGVGKEAYDSNLRKELELKHELEQKQVQEKEEKLKPEDGNNQDFTFEVDGETGEMVPVPISSQRDTQPESQQTSDSNELMSEAMRVLEQHSMQAEVLPYMQSVQYQHAQGQTSTVVPNSTLPMPGNMSLDANASLPQPTLARMESSEIAGLVADMQNLTHSMNITEPAMSRQNSFDRQWQEVAELLDLPGASNMNTSLDLNDTFSESTNPLIQNATLAPQPPRPDVFPRVQPGSMMPQTNFTPQFGFENMTEPTPMDPQEMLFPNITSSVTPVTPVQGPNMTLLNNASMLHNLLNENMLDEMDMDLADLDEGKGTSVADDASSDDSAVSMNNDNLDLDQDCAFSNTSSIGPFEGLEGATGGIDEMKESKFIPPLNKYVDCSQEYRQEDMFSNYSSASNDSDFRRYSSSSDGDYRHIHHNHTYPLQPGQEPKDHKGKNSADKSSSESKDEKRAKDVNLPFTTEEIIHSPVERFNEMLQKYSLSEAQLQLTRDIRRRGKNKVAAQNCRKRKMNAITGLEDEVIDMRKERDKLAKESRLLEKQKEDFTSKMEKLNREVFSRLRDDNGQPYDPSQYFLDLNEDGEVFLWPRNSSTPRDFTGKNSRKRKGRKQ